MKKPSISNEAVVQATGRSWREWFEMLDVSGLELSAHKDIASWLQQHTQVSGWWAQAITVEYEYHHGKRVVGQTKDAGFQVGVQKTFLVSDIELWNYLFDDGVGVWIGGAQPFTPTPNDIVDYDNGVLRVKTVKHPQRVRMLVDEKHRPPYVLQFYITKKGAQKSALTVHIEKLQDSDDRVFMKERWQQFLAIFQKQITK